MVANMQVVHNILNNDVILGGTEVKSNDFVIGSKTSIKTKILIAA